MFLHAYSQLTFSNAVETLVLGWQLLPKQCFFKKKIGTPRIPIANQKPCEAKALSAPVYFLKTPGYQEGVSRYQNDHQHHIEDSYFMIGKKEVLEHQLSVAILGPLFHLDSMVSPGELISGEYKAPPGYW